MQITLQSWNYNLNTIVDLCKVKSEKYIIYLPWMNFKFEEIDWLSNIFLDLWYNFVRFNFKYHQDWNSIDNFNLESDLEDIQSLINYLDLNWFNIKCIGVIAKSFWWVKWFLLNDSRIKVYWFIAPATFFWKHSNIDNIKTLKYWEIKNIKDVILDADILDNWNLPIIIIHWKNDNIVNIRNSKKIYNNIYWIKKIIIIEWMWHSYDNKFNEIINENLISFFKKYL